MRHIIQKVLRHTTLVDKPPVMVDVGASGDLDRDWSFVAAHAICVAFDADTRDFELVESEGNGWKKLYTLNRIVSERSSAEVNFYLTKSPYCSSALRPDEAAIEPWDFRSLFTVQEEIKLPATDLGSALAEVGVDYIDWFKTDSQGTDLRIFRALDDKVIRQVKVAEFEPGIIDSYLGEDKLHGLMSYMETQPFWVTGMHIKGSQRIDQRDVDVLPVRVRRYYHRLLKTAPGWCEISYMNQFQDGELNTRDYLLGWLFATLKGEQGFALRLARIGRDIDGDPLFDELYAFSQKRLSRSYGMFVLSTLEKLYRKLWGEEWRG
ncbi:MAG: hypothetical protein ABJN62_01730 [Halioglobus sp.]